MNDVKILSIQDVSCVGQCSLTVALPIISACGLETAILPSAVLSTHTGGFKGYTFRDLTADMPKIAAHWKKEGIRFSAIYTGYLGSAEQIGYVLDIADSCLEEGGKLIVDPAMADEGKLYAGFDEAFVGEMRRLAARADVLIPNLTEAAMLTGLPYKKEGFEKNEIEAFCRKLTELGAKAVVLTGVTFSKSQLGVAVCEMGEISYYFHERLPGGSHGTGDVYASAFTGALYRGRTMMEAARIAADFTVECIRVTKRDPSHWYGVKFEQVLGQLIRSLQE